MWWLGEDWEYWLEGFQPDLIVAGRAGPDIELAGRRKLLCTSQAKEGREAQQEIRATLWWAGTSNLGAQDA